jgi:CRP-like cAMP-binding protein
MRIKKPEPNVGDLGAVALFRECTPRELDWLDGMATRLEVPPGRVLCVEDEIGSEFFAISTGSVRVERGGRTIASLGPGDVFGELALLARNALSRRTATVVATEQMRVIVFNRAEFNSMVKSVPSVTRRLLERVSNLAVCIAMENALLAEGQRASRRVHPSAQEPRDGVVLSA